MNTAPPVRPSDNVLSVSIQDAADILRRAPRVLVLTGAGISAESGVPTFRGAGERWRDKHFSELANPEAFARDPREIWDWYLYRRSVVARCVPNAAHDALARWIATRDGVTLVTQNVDGLHERAGSDPVRLHGSLWRNRCTACGVERAETALDYHELPTSPCCGAPERPAIVWFGERIPFDAFHAGLLAAVEAHAVLVVGTSGTVHPASSFIHRARANRSPIVEINPEYSAVPATHRLRGNAAEILPLLVGA